MGKKNKNNGRELSGAQKALVLETVKTEKINVDDITMDRLFNQLPNSRIKPATIAFSLKIDPEIVHNLRKSLQN